jgi:tetratricopeptide (TPR) repeat protein
MPLRTALLVLLAGAAIAVGTAFWQGRPAPGDSLAVALLPLSAPAADANAREIARLQQAIGAGGPPVLLERLGWAFVARARREDDPGFHELAERAARALLAQAPRDAGGRLLLGHALLSQHRFAEAERLARPLAEQRGLPADHGLLGDALLSQGRLEEAAAAYQAMMDLRPDGHAYARAAELRWLTGDLEGAREAMAVAARAASPRSPEGTAWAFAQRALYELRAQDLAGATRSCDAALAAHPDLALAWFVRGRALLAQDRFAEAADALERSAARSPLPETLWSLAEALAAAGREAEARRVEERLVATGEGADARGLALYLASRGRDLPRAARLLERELGARQDAFTLAAAALARSRAGDPPGAWPLMQRALAPGTPDPRIHLHAGLVAAAAGRGEAGRWLRAAAERRALLLPSERRALALALDS